MNIFSLVFDEIFHYFFNFFFIFLFRQNVANRQLPAKFRTIFSNLQDRTNDDFWRRVILGEISASNLHKMSPHEMSSAEKKEWRKTQQKNDLDQIIKLEEIKQKEVNNNNIFKY